MKRLPDTRIALKEVYHRRWLSPLFWYLVEIHDPVIMFS